MRLPAGYRFRDNTDALRRQDTAAIAAGGGGHPLDHPNKPAGHIEAALAHQYCPPFPAELATPYLGFCSSAVG